MNKTPRPYLIIGDEVAGDAVAADTKVFRDAELRQLRGVCRDAADIEQAKMAVLQCTGGMPEQWSMSYPNQAPSPALDVISPEGELHRCWPYKEA